jgi:ATP-dependent RNA helicase DeaD
VTFRVTWGGTHGADPRRLLALVCRRGDIRGSDVGAIRVEPAYSLVDVAQSVAEKFAAAGARPDPRDPRVRIERHAQQQRHARTERPHPPQGERPHPARGERPHPAESDGRARIVRRPPEAGRGRPHGDKPRKPHGKSHQRP